MEAPRKLRPIRHLVEALRERGLSYSKPWLHRQEGKGKTPAETLENQRTGKSKLYFRRVPGTGWRKVTTEDIKEIVEAFSPGGVGRWSYDGYFPPRDWFPWRQER